MTIKSSTGLRNHMMAVGSFKNAMDGCVLRIYGGARPASASDTPSSVMLAEIRLTKPAGVLTDVLTLTPEDAGLITASGSATWARLVNGAEQTAADMDCTDDTGAGPVKLAQVALLIGGSAALTRAVLG